MLTNVGYTVACMELVRVRIGEDEGEAVDAVRNEMDEHAYIYCQDVVLLGKVKATFCSFLALRMTISCI